jgi:beta-glucosidase
VRRIVRTKLVYLTREDPQAYPPSLAGSAEHAALAREVAEKAMVLLKNDGPLLPLDRSKVKKIAVVGRLAEADNTGDHGSSDVTQPHYTSALKGLRDHLGAGATVLHADGKDLAEVARVAGEADAVVVAAGTRWDEVGEYITDDEGLRQRPQPKRPLVATPSMEGPGHVGGDLVRQRCRTWT